MQPIVCRYIRQAWKVKKAYDAIGCHVRIVLTPTAKDSSRKVWMCYINPKPLPSDKNPVLSFFKNLVKISNQG